MGYTNIINELVAYIEKNGFTVKLLSDEIPDDVCGQIRYIKREIHIGQDISAEEAMYTLIHEGGHMLSYNRLFLQQGQPQPDRREELALLYGWKIIKDLKLPITKEMWKLNC